MLVQVGDSDGLATVRTLGRLVVVDLSDMPPLICHSKLLSTLGARLSNPFMKLFYMPSKVVHTYVPLTIWAVSFLSKVDALHMVGQQLLGLKLFLTIRALIVLDLIMGEPYMMI